MANNGSRMRRYAQMRMASGGNRNDSRLARSEMNMAYGNMTSGNMEMGGGYSEMRGNYGGRSEMEARFRDRRGREHYDNGRFAPRSAMVGNDGVESRMGYDGEPENRRRYRRTSDGRFRSGMDDMEDAYPGRISPVYREEAGMDMNTIGFNANREMDYNYRSDAGYYPRSEMDSNPGQMSSGGHASSKSTSMTKDMADEWTREMKNEDGTKGPHWTMEQVKQVMAQKGIQYDPLKIYLALNMMYSDYCAVLKKHNMNKMDVYLDLALAFLNDKDVQGDKLAKYYEYVVNG